jgi:hypothetical protein
MKFPVDLGKKRLYFMGVQSTKGRLTAQRPGALCLNDEKFGMLSGNHIYKFILKNRVRPY